MDDTWVRNCTCIFFPLVRTRKKNELPHIIFIIVCRSDVQFTAPLPRFSVDVIILPPIFSHCVRHWNGCHVRLAQRNPRSGRYVHPLVRFICRSDIVVSVIPGRRMVDRMYGTECVPPVVDRWITRLREKDWSVSICREHQRKGGGGKSSSLVSPFRLTIITGPSLYIRHGSHVAFLMIFLVQSSFNQCATD